MRLASDPSPGVRGDLAGNPALDDALIRALAGDRDPAVRRRLAHHPRVPLDVLIRLARTARIGAALVPRVAAASAAETEELAMSPDPAARMLVAQRRDLPSALRDRLAGDPDAKVVKALAAHPGLTEAQLRAMVERHGVRVLAQVAANPDASPALLEDLVRHEPGVRKVLREVARTAGRRSRRCASAWRTNAPGPLPPATRRWRRRSSPHCSPTRTGRSCRRRQPTRRCRPP